MTNYEKIREASIKANPEIGQQPCTHKLMHDENGCPFSSHEREPRLADVLLVMNGKGKGIADQWLVNTRGHFYKQTPRQFATSCAEKWNLKQDDLSKQSPETLEFIASLL